MKKQLPVLTPLRFSDFVNALSPKTGDELDFCEVFSNIIGSGSCYPVSSGRAALYIAFQILKQFSDKRYVIIPAYTCPTVPLSVARAGLKVRLCDISIDTLNLDTDSLSQLADDDTLCILATHLFGFPCDIERITRVAKRTGSFVLEDAAQALGARYRDKMIGSFGNMSCFSLDKGKNITAYEGGVLVSNNAEYNDHINRIFDKLERPGAIRKVSTFVKLLGMKLMSYPRTWWLISKLPLGFESQYHSIDFKLEKLSDWQAAFALSVLKRLNAINQIRIKNALYLVESLRLLDSIMLPKIIDGSEPVYLRLPVVIGDMKLRDEIHDELHQRGISVSKMYLRSLNRYNYLKGIVPNIECPQAEYVANRILTLPTHPLVTEEDMKVIVDVFSQFFWKG